jgi:hypothetical protein
MGDERDRWSEQHRVDLAEVVVVILEDCSERAG